MDSTSTALLVGLIAGLILLSNMAALGLAAYGIYRSLLHQPDLKRDENAELRRQVATLEMENQAKDVEIARLHERIWQHLTPRSIQSGGDTNIIQAGPGASLDQSAAGRHNAQEDNPPDSPLLGGPLGSLGK